MTGVIKKKSILVIFIGIVFLNLLLLNGVAKKNNEEVLTEQIKVNQALSFYNEEDYDKSVCLLRSMIEESYPDSYIVNLYLARSLRQANDQEGANFHYKRAYNINPGLLKDEGFLSEIEEVEDEKLGH